MVAAAVVVSFLSPPPHLPMACFTVKNKAPAIKSTSKAKGSASQAFCLGVRFRLLLEV